MTTLDSDRSAGPPTARSQSTAVLERSLRANAGISVAAGLVLASAPATIGDILDVSLTTPLRLFGLFLIAHGGLLVAGVTRGPLRTIGKLNLAAIVPYPAAMAFAAVVVEPIAGKALVIADGLVIAACAVGIGVGLRASSR